MPTPLPTPSHRVVILGAGRGVREHSPGAVAPIDDTGCAWDRLLSSDLELDRPANRDGRPKEYHRIAGTAMWGER